ncbi:MAG: hypothetical protein IT301_04685 [Dehalococcoidia bacterium]|nr:hypothetical protein [Dehalococcoidia bacterium]
MRALMALSSAVALLVSACGGNASSFPAEAECPAPAPLPTVRTAPGSVSTRAYLTRLRTSSESLVKLRDTLRASYPDDTFYRRDAFRPDFARYADETLCTAQAMLDLAAPDARFERYETNLDAALAELITHTRAGRDAVRQRNTSEYRDWYKDVDAKTRAVREAAFAQP